MLRGLEESISDSRLPHRPGKCRVLTQALAVALVKRRSHRVHRKRLPHMPLPLPQVLPLLFRLLRVVRDLGATSKPF